MVPHDPVLNRFLAIKGVRLLKFLRSSPNGCMCLVEVNKQTCATVCNCAGCAREMRLHIPACALKIGSPGWPTCNFLVRSFGRLGLSLASFFYMLWDSTVDSASAAVAQSWTCLVFVCF